MAFYIEIDKISKTVDEAAYEFSDSGTGTGRLRLDKASGNVTEVVPAPGDSRGHRFQRAAVKVIRHWKEGPLPDKTCWAS
jgi:hypothetical protein